MLKKTLVSLLVTLFIVGASSSIFAANDRLESELKNELRDELDIDENKAKNKNKKNKAYKGCRGASDDHISDRGREQRNDKNCDNDNDYKGKDKKNKNKKDKKNRK